MDGTAEAQPVSTSVGLAVEVGVSGVVVVVSVMVVMVVTVVVVMVLVAMAEARSIDYLSVQGLKSPDRTGLFCTVPAVQGLLLV